MTTDNLPKRAADGRWLTSGNPAGRPKRVEQIAELAQQHAPEALAKIVELMSHADPKVALAASNAILDRAFGRPFQSVQAQVEKWDMGKLWLEAVKMANAPPTIEAEPQQTRIIGGMATPIANDDKSGPSW